MAEAGWYADPSGAPQLRYFDGAAWSEEVEPFVPPQGPPVSKEGTTRPGGGRSASRSRRLALVVALVVFGLVGGGIALANRAGESSSERLAGIAAMAESQAETPEPEPEPADLQQLDWSKLPWETACVETGERVERRLTVGSEPGELWSHVGADGGFDSAAMNYIVDADSVVFGDVTDDGLRNAVFATSCFLGNDFLHYVEVWGHDEDGQPHQFAPVFEFSKRDGTIESFEVVDGRLRVHTSEPAQGDDFGHLNGYPVQVVTDWTHDGSDWLAEEVSRTDATPHPEPAPEPAPQPDPEPAPAAGACEQLFGAGGSSMYDDAYCADVLRNLEECERKMEADPDWVYNDLSGGWENVHTGEWEPPCDI